jgi:hypothetical protein
LPPAASTCAPTAAAARLCAATTPCGYLTTDLRGGSGGTSANVMTPP